MKITVITAVWKRPEVFEIFAKGIVHLMANSTHKIQVVVAGSEGSVSRKMVERHGFLYVETPNEPLAQKHNVACRHAQQTGADYYLFLGSDDVISPECLKVYEPYMNRKVDFIGITDFYFYDLTTKRASYWGGYIDKRRGHTVGAGRMISSKLMKLWGWAPFEIRHSRVLDDSMQNRLQTTRCTMATFSLRANKVIAVDVKSSTNMTPFEIWPNTHFIPVQTIQEKLPFICAV